jgi:alanine racemase
MDSGSQRAVVGQGTELSTKKEGPIDGSWVELDALAFFANLRFFEDVLQKRAALSSAQGGPSESGSAPPLLGVVLKGNAYGHGLLEMSRLMALISSISVAYVFSLQEARLAAAHLRRDQRILILGAHPEPMPSWEDALRFEWVVSSASQVLGIVAWLSSCVPLADQRLAVHIHFDSGLGREGFGPEDGVQAARALLATGRAAVVGSMTHFANTEDVTRQDYARQQVARFSSCALGLDGALALLGFGAAERHLAATAATLVLPESSADAVRIGIGAYGLWPSNETRLGYVVSRAEPRGAPEPLQPILSWRVRSQCIKKLEAGSFVGYGCTYRCEEPTLVGVFPVGYADGYARSLTSRAYVLVQGLRCPVIGRVMMNHIIVALPERLGLDVGETVVATLLGHDGAESITAEDLATWSGTINYESVTRISPHLRRIVIGADI